LQEFQRAGDEDEQPADEAGGDEFARAHAE
jgi:hypothetical protein